MASQDARLPLPTLPEMIEKVGIGATQLRFIFTGGGVWFADGAELLLISAVTSSVAAEWNLDPLQRGSMVTMVYLGVLVGNVISGPVGDKHGRRQLILASYVGIFVFSIISSFMADFGSLCFWRFFVGFSFGLGQPPWNVLASEVTPAKWRIVTNGLSQGLFALGEVFSALLIIGDDPTMENLDWRKLLRLGAIPSFLFWVAATFFLGQSPFFLAQTGQHEEAVAVLGMMQRDNCLPNFSVQFAALPAPREDTDDLGIMSQFRKLGTGPFFITTIIMSYTCFTCNFLYYGTMYAFPNLLPILGRHAVHGASPGVQLLVGAVWEVPGIALACFFGTCMPRKPVLQLYCFTTGLCVILFVAGSTGGDAGLPTLAWHIGYYGIKCMVQSGWVVAYMYVTEVYPTTVRTTGTSLNFAAGRVAAIISPLVYEKLKEVTGSYVTFFYILAGSLFLNCAVIHFLPIETFNRSLAGDVDEERTPTTYGTGSTAQSSQPA